MPEGAIVIFSAHGVAPEVYEQARARTLKAIDATCPLVTKVHQEARRFAAEDYDILLIGHEGHEEVIGTAGEAPAHVQLVDGPDGVDKVTVRDPDKVVWLSQTTLSVDETMETVARLKQRLPLLQSPPSDDICYATSNRQHVVKEIAPQCDVVIVVGSRNSSNSVRLAEVALDRRRPRRLPGRLRPRDRRRVARRRDHGRAHLRRQRAGRAGDAGARPPGRAGLRRGRRGHHRPRDAHLLAAAGAQAGHAQGRGGSGPQAAATLAATVRSWTRTASDRGITAPRNCSSEVKDREHRPEQERPADCRDAAKARTAAGAGSAAGCCVRRRGRLGRQVAG